MIPRFLVNHRASGVDYAHAEQAIRRELSGRACHVSPDLTLSPHDAPHLVVAVGGDGTVNWVINRCDPRDLVLGVIPLGSANDLATEMGVPSGVGPAWRVVADGRYEEIDLVEVNGRRLATCGGLGLASDVAMLAAGWKSRDGWRGRLARRLGSLVYLVATVIEVARDRRPIEAELRVGDARRTETVSMVIVSNQPRLGKHFSASPEASNRDGLVHVCAVRTPRSRLRLLWVCFQIFRGTPDRCPEVVQMRGPELTLRIDGEMTFFGDGEALSTSRSFQVCVLPRALRVASARRAARRTEPAHA